MKEEYKKELKEIHSLLNCNDKESKILGVNLFLSSKWVKDLKNHPDYEYLFIEDCDSNGSGCDYENLLDFFECDFSTLEYIDETDATPASDLIECLFNGISHIVKITNMNDFS